MGASYSLVCCGVLGGALSHPDNGYLPSLVSDRSYQEKLKLFGAITLIGLILFFIFYSSCDWSLDYCGLRNVSSWKMVLISMFGGIFLGGGLVGLITSYLRKSEDPYAGGGYNPMNPMVSTQPAVSMI
mmetsp:Transcript_12242/g.17958  ORF Transcript_12242/g.17958 Transcript_12242/m.17958 type:complete len:128 (+) Transcript_12242:69-452(+)